MNAIAASWSLICLGAKKTNHGSVSNDEKKSAYVTGLGNKLLKPQNENNIIKYKKQRKQSFSFQFISVSI
jgi:hypothetical protein